MKNTRKHAQNQVDNSFKIVSRFIYKFEYRSRRVNFRLSISILATQTFQHSSPKIDRIVVEFIEFAMP